MDDTDQNKLDWLRGIVSDLGKLPEAQGFVDPIDHTAPGKNDYYDVLREFGLRPMNLTVIQNRFDSKFYRSPYDVLDDMRRIFECCYAYYDDDHIMSISAMRLQAWWTVHVAAGLRDES